MEEYAYLTNNNFTIDAHKYKSCNHELDDDEIWLGNTSGNKKWESGVDIPNEFAHLKTIRLGEQAYYITGDPISRDYCRPLIINKSEFEEYELILKKRRSQV